MSVASFSYRETYEVEMVEGNNLRRRASWTFGNAQSNMIA